MKVIAKDFHPMRGHVEQGRIVLFSDGRELELRRVTRGWALFDGNCQVGETAAGANEVTALVLSLEAA